MTSPLPLTVGGVNDFTEARKVLKRVKDCHRVRLEAPEKIWLAYGLSPSETLLELGLWWFDRDAMSCGDEKYAAPHLRYAVALGLQ